MTPPDDIAAIAATDTLLGLADRCEKATGPDRELDALIFRAIGAPVPFQAFGQMVALTFDEAEQCYFAPIGDMRVRYSPPAYSASLDAAMALVPEGMAWNLYSDGPTYRASAEIGPHPIGGSIFQASHGGEAETPTLALCAAALRARAHQENDHEPKD